MDRHETFERFRQLPKDQISFEVRRETVQHGRSFSAKAMESLHEEMMTFIGARLVERWESTGEPPTVMTVKISVQFG
jgi:hypothetical protein